MSNWRTYILQHFQEPIHRLTLVADPDGLLLEEELLAAIRQNGFDLLTFEDPIAFRYAYESRYRQHWDQGQDTDLVVILRSPESGLRALPYDLLESGRTLTFSLPDLFPKLSYPVISDLDPVYLQPLYEAYQGYPGPAMGDRASALFALKHVFGLVPDLVKTPTDLLKLLLSRHVRRERIPPRLDAVLLDSLEQNQLFKRWPLAALLRNPTDFFAFLQDQWSHYLAAQQPPGATWPVREPAPAYQIDEPLPFDEPDVRAYVNTLFLDGKLKPVLLPEGLDVDGWAQIGVKFDELAFERRRFARLLENLERELPAADAPYKDWIVFATRWAELSVLRHRLASQSSGETIARYKALHLKVESQFADWMLGRYHTLHSLPFLPAPVMGHRIPDYMAACHSQQPASGLALVVIDGLAVDQWLIIRQVWNEQAPDWTIQESAVFAWVPTVTSISRQAIFAGTAPQFFPKSWQSTDKEASHWQRFWHERGFHPESIGYVRNLGVKGLGENGHVLPDGKSQVESKVVEVVKNPKTLVVGLVVNTVDNIMHGMQLGTAGMHQQIQLWLSRYRYLTDLVATLLQESFTVYLTSDHGNVWAQGIDRPSEGVLVDKRGERARIYTDPAFLSLAKQQSPTAIEWTNVGLPTDLNVLLAPQLDAFLNFGHQAICHGGIALEEVIVPFIQISRK